MELLRTGRGERALFAMSYEAALRYFFHIGTGERLEHDRAGLECVDDEQAIDVGMNVARRLSDETATSGEELRARRVEVVDEAGQQLAVIPVLFAAAEKPSPASS